MSKKIITFVLLAISAVLCIYSFTALPDQVVVQFGFNGEVTNTLPKLLALFIPLGISVLGLYMKLKSDENKGTVLQIVGILAFILTLLFNR
ncbi:MAG: DUF1648 domain-containing protein [Erysipelotrichaceae bacterium]